MPRESSVSRAHANINGNLTILLKVNKTAVQKQLAAPDVPPRRTGIPENGMGYAWKTCPVSNRGSADRAANRLNSLALVAAGSHRMWARSARLRSNARPTGTHHGPRAVGPPRRPCRRRKTTFLSPFRAAASTTAASRTGGPIIFCRSDPNILEWSPGAAVRPRGSPPPLRHGSADPRYTTPYRGPP